MKYQYIKPPQQLDAVLDLVPSWTSLDVLHHDLALMQTDLGLSVVLVASENLSDRSKSSINASDTLIWDGNRFYLPSGELALIITEMDLLFSDIGRNPRDAVEALNASRFGTSEDDVFKIVGNLFQSTLLSLGVRDATEFVDGKEGVDTIKIDRDYASGDFKLERVDGSTFVMTAPKYLVAPMTVKNVEQIEFNDTGVTTVDALVGSPTVDIILELFGEVRMLKGLTEINNGEIHVVIYEGEIFDYAEIDPAITTVIRDGVFTDEFAQEIAEIAPAHAGISYETVVGIVGVAAIDDFLISVAGADGNYVA